MEKLPENNKTLEYEAIIFSVKTKRELKCQNEHNYKYNTNLLLKIRFWKVYVLGSKKGDFNWCRFWAKNRHVIWCCGSICQEVFNLIQIEIDPGYNVLWV